VLQPDLIHFECGFAAAKWHFLHKVLNCPMTVSLQAGELDFLVGPGFFGSIWQEAAGIHLPSESARRAALRYGLPASLPYAVIPPSVDLTFYDLGERPYLEKVGSQERPLRLLSVCKLAWSKGLEHALMVVRLLLDRGIHCEYDIIGAGPYADALHFAKMQLGFDGVVRFWGNQPRAQVRASLATADIFLHTAVADGFCYGAFEAMAMQLPIVCTAADGLEEHVQSGKTGFILPVGDLSGIVEKVALLAQTPSLHQQFGQAARAYMVEAVRPSDELAAFARFFQQAAHVKN
jgi:colanic acid/amylovoran biosynthesis glycosyltransferase